MADKSDTPLFTLVLDDPECLILLDTVTRLAQLDSDGVKFPPGVKPATHHNVAVAALRQGLKALATNAVSKQRAGVLVVDRTPRMGMPFAPDWVSGVDS
ncbi:hypothetical protein [Polyangium mundeleinium]|uniref:Uncharacterized protein n=1 Tax=Polyangium mundeleinium TaxID=2995306 RepID=A0ABT5EZJ7_9BACT|nr:hypothetical protein [Polyangium mundeleinium]MDC0746692.1 hypothetical protein [Polyangium mundeleinium]